MGLTDDELCRALDADPIALISGELEHRPELPLLLTLTDGVDEAVLRRWLRAEGPGGRPLDTLLARDYRGFEDALDDLRRRGLVIRARGPSRRARRP
ncbi:MAG TPA: hypothetical protein VIL64_03200 [Solirubrobacteraceae bacterium]